MGKRSKKSIERQTKKMMKSAGLAIPTKKPVGGLEFSSKGKKTNKRRK